MSNLENLKRIERHLIEAVQLADSLEEVLFVEDRLIQFLGDALCSVQGAIKERDMKVYEVVVVFQSSCVVKVLAEDEDKAKTEAEDFAIEFYNELRIDPEIDYSEVNGVVELAAGETYDVAVY